MTTTQLSRISGATARQLQYWDDGGVLRAERYPRLRRRYQPHQARQAAVLAAISRPGASMGFCRRVLRTCREAGVWTAGEPSWLVLCGQTVEVARDAREAVRIAAAMGGPVRLVEIR